MRSREEGNLKNFDLFGFLFAPQNMPFAIALGILGGLLLVEVLTTVLGVPISQKLNAVLDLQGPDLDAPDHLGHTGLDVAHHDGAFGTAWDWLNAGRVPLLVLLMLMLAAFGSIGYMIEGVAHSLTGWLPTGFAAIPAFFVTLPVTRRASLLISKIIPRDETYAVEASGLVGRTGIIVTGPLAVGTMARVRIKDAHGNQHFPWVRTTDQSLRLDDGAHVLLIEQRGNEYLAVAADPKLID
jgi:Protein of unknown function (DUF1449)